MNKMNKEKSYLESKGPLSELVREITSNVLNSGSLEDPTSIRYQIDRLKESSTLLKQSNKFDQVTDGKVYE